MQLDGRPASVFATTDTPKVTGTRTLSKPEPQLQPVLRRSATRKHSSAQTDPAADSPLKQAKRSALQSPQLVSLLTALKTRLGNLEIDLDRLRQENELLRRGLRPGSGVDEIGSSWATSTLAKSRCEELAAYDRAIKEHEGLRNSLQDRARQISLLEARYDHLKERARAKAALHEESVNRIEQLSEQLLAAVQRAVGRSPDEECVDRKAGRDRTGTAVPSSACSAGCPRREAEKCPTERAREGTARGRQPPGRRVRAAQTRKRGP
ncbi:hypothetical protein PybrP1_004662 [[Pythium] brassicae (nom. inval.)]|nr:hypothetical protein PybrP1_004662 [[Pythium] brassicae (nom. inval.)]